MTFAAEGTQLIEYGTESDHKPSSRTSSSRETRPSSMDVSLALQRLQHTIEELEREDRQSRARRFHSV